MPFISRFRRYKQKCSPQRMRPAPSFLNIFTCCIRLNDRSGTRTGFWEGACKIPGSPSVDDSPCMRSMTFARKVRLEIGRKLSTSFFSNLILFQYWSDYSMRLWDCDSQPCWSDLYHLVEIENQPAPCDVVRHTKLFLDGRASHRQDFLEAQKRSIRPYSTESYNLNRCSCGDLFYSRGHHSCTCLGDRFAPRKIDEAEDTEYRGVV